MLKKIGLLAFILPALLRGIDYSPWYPQMAEVQARTNYLFQIFQKIQSPQGDKKYPSYDHFLGGSLGMALFNWYGEFDVRASDTRHRSFGLDSLSLEARYQILDDVAAVDPVSLIAGVILSKVTKPALHDLGSFHHAQFEVEAHLSIGKEVAFGKFWTEHWWALLAAGIGDVGSPWARCSLHWEQNCYNVHRWGIFVNSLWGFGGKNITSVHHFHGYGPIAHRSVDIGGAYSYWIETKSIQGRFKACYAFRAYARNFPKGASMVTLSFLLPFGTGI